jgi:uncharacterized membrane protein YphA (DoxX/SURF4 family)
MGIRFSSVNKLKRSSAEAMKVDSDVTVAVLMFFFTSGFLTAGFGALVEEDAGGGVETAGVPARLGSPLTVRSFP